MSCYHAEIINLTLKDSKLIKDFSILNVKKRFLGYVKIYTISVPETIHAEVKNKWDEIIEYAKSLGIPDEQCDFLPENFESQNYI